MISKPTIKHDVVIERDEANVRQAQETLNQAIVAEGLSEIFSADSLQQVLKVGRNGVGHAPLVLMLGFTEGVENLLKTESVVASALVDDKTSCLVREGVLLK